MKRFTALSFYNHVLCKHSTVSSYYLYVSVYNPSRHKSRVNIVIPMHLVLDSIPKMVPLIGRQVENRDRNTGRTVRTTPFGHDWMKKTTVSKAPYKSNRPTIIPRTGPLCGCNWIKIYFAAHRLDRPLYRLPPVAMAMQKINLRAVIKSLIYASTMLSRHNSILRIHACVST